MTRIDRRALFASGAAAALLAATGVSLEAAPKSGGTLRLAVPRDDSLEHVARGAVFDTLTEIGPDGALRGELASSWQMSEDARTWQFDLRDDVLFHDGMPLEAKDVEAVLREFGRVEITGKTLLRLELAQADVSLPFRLADNCFVITRNGQSATPLNNANGTGCYCVERAQDDRHFLGRKVGEHYKSGHSGWVDRFEVIVIPDARVRAEALRDGFVDVAALPAPESLRDRARFRYHPSADDLALAFSDQVGLPRQIGSQSALDDGRIAERWWVT